MCKIVKIKSSLAVVFYGELGNENRLLEKNYKTQATIEPQEIYLINSDRMTDVGVFNGKTCIFQSFHLNCCSCQSYCSGKKNKVKGHITKNNKWTLFNVPIVGHNTKANCYAFLEYRFIEKNGQRANHHYGLPIFFHSSKPPLSWPPTNI
ncbi:MAG: hypothetical protein AAB596_01530 [Patescibacteria group bacterium]